MALALVEHEPHPALRGSVLRATDFAETGAPTRRLEQPLVGVVLIVSTGPDLLVDDRWVGSFTSGLYEGPVLTGHGGAQAGYQVSLTLEGAWRLLGVPPAALANEIVPLDAVLGPLAGELEERIAGAADSSARHAAAEAVLLRRLLERPEPLIAPEVAHAVGRLRATRGAARVEALADEVGWSRRHLGARVREALGVAPKSLGRLIRMEHAVGRLAAGDALADVAFEGGFADQPHFNREFKALVGCAPTAFPFVQDVAAAA